MLLTILLKLSLANYFIYSICLFFVYAWMVIFTDFFVKSDQVEGTKKGQANLLKTHEGQITEEDQKMIDEKLSSMGQVMKNEMLDDRIQQNFVMSPVTTSDESSLQKEQKKVVIETPTETETPKENSENQTNNSINNNQNPVIEAKEDLTVPAFANEDVDFNSSDENNLPLTPNTFDSYSEEGLGVMGDDFLEEVTFVSPNTKLTKQTICRIEWQNDLEKFWRDFQAMDEEQKNVILQKGQNVFEKIKKKQIEEHHKLKIDMESMMYKKFTKFENIAISDFISQEELFCLNVINLTGLEIDTELLKKAIVLKYK